MEANAPSSLSAADDLAADLSHPPLSFSPARSLNAHGTSILPCAIGLHACRLSPVTSFFIALQIGATVVAPYYTLHLSP